MKTYLLDEAKRIHTELQKAFVRKDTELLRNTIDSMADWINSATLESKEGGNLSCKVFQQEFKRLGYDVNFIPKDDKGDCFTAILSRRDTNTILAQLTALNKVK